MSKGSMGLVYLPTWMVDFFNGKLIDKCTSPMDPSWDMNHVHSILATAMFVGSTVSCLTCQVTKPQNQLRRSDASHRTVAGLVGYQIDISILMNRYEEWGQVMIQSEKANQIHIDHPKRIKLYQIRIDHPRSKTTELSNFLALNKAGLTRKDLYDGFSFFFARVAIVICLCLS